MSNHFTGTIQKLSYRLGEPLEYFLSIGNQSILLNSYLGKQITLAYQNRIVCEHCGKATKKSYHQGYCFLCSQQLARCDICIVRPEKCHYHLGSCREPDWAASHCFIPHIVYLANTSGLKVGITRETQIPTRWVDQGAEQALPFLKVQNRYHSGLVEAQLKKNMNDRTDWRKMLRGEIETIDLLEKRNELLTESFLRELVETCHQTGVKDKDPIELIQNPVVTTLQYPVLEYPKKISSCNFEKTPTVTGYLLGIKGQYLILDVGVINMRSLAGYVFSLHLDSVSNEL